MGATTASRKETFRCISSLGFNFTLCFLLQRIGVERLHEEYMKIEVLLHGDLLT